MKIADFKREVRYFPNGRKKMRKNRLLITGMVIGIVVSLSVQAFAAANIEKIQAYVNHKMSFEFNGEKKELPDGYEVLVYKDRSYVPARFVAENLGATVDWNDSTKVISLKADKSNNSTDKGSTDNNEDKKSQIEYKSLPQTQESINCRVSIVTSFKDDNNNVPKLAIYLKNKGKNVIEYDQMAATFTANGRTYETEGADAIYIDGRLYKSLKEDEEVDAYIPIPGKLKNPEKMQVKLTVKVTENYETTTEDFYFNVAL